MPETLPDHPPMAAMPSAPRQRLRYYRILDAAGSSARKGLESVDLTEVAAKADVPLGTLYRYFPTPTHLMLALYRHQLGELQAAGRATAARFRGRALGGLVMEIFHMRVMQPAVEQCLSRGVYLPDRDTTVLLRDIDALGEKVVANACGDAIVARVLLLTVTGLVQSVRNRRLSLFEAEEDLKKACARLAPATEGSYTLHQTA
ncbi:MULTISPECIES: TetR/AcrR family transcriptional regulator [Micrococcaceae]|uniref:AcrR family transcriptional regulator n=1 Tax=Pseudarthrobacter siccitolerans TaxID=861266 RepID=A0ABU0PLG6_9MICC|nr:MULTISPECIES: TetR/AcrR family transcriptional regulator [Micrococcaceae]MDQ0674815.1 AcrR family transcriptional regulator [Pseudarthrobacter siccitolerans]MDQ0693496.1 AcrR family transcriptional regulator [Arthrobacter sp. W4I7]